METWARAGSESARSTIAELVLDRPHDAPEAAVGPDDRGLRVAPEERAELRRLVRVLPRLREGHVDVVVEDDDEPGLAREVEDPVEGGIDEAGRLSRDLRGDELLVDGELADPGEDAGEGPQHALDVVGRVHVGGVEAGDHGVEARLLLLREGAVGHRDEGVGERVVVEGRVRLQVIGGREVARVPVRPGLLERDAEEGDPSDLRAHDLQEVVDVGPLLDVVRQVEVRVVHDVARRGRRGRLRAQEGRRGQSEGDGGGERVLQLVHDAGLRIKSSARSSCGRRRRCLPPGRGLPCNPPGTCSDGATPR